MNRCIQVYTGDGKGKTTAAIGLAVRAVGAGMKVLFLQFMKSKYYSEQDVLEKMPGVTLKMLGKPCFIVKKGMLSDEEIAAWGDEIEVFEEGNPPQDYAAMMKAGVEEAREALRSQAYDLIVLDEYNVAAFFGLISKEDTQSLLDEYTGQAELVFTGRNAPQEILDAADLITEMKEVRHYYHKGVEARKGIEC